MVRTIYNIAQYSTNTRIFNDIFKTQHMIAHTSQIGNLALVVVGSFYMDTVV